MGRPVKNKLPEGSGFVFLSDFSDIDNFDVKYTEGEDASFLSEDRLNYLIDKGLVGISESDKPKD